MCVRSQISEAMIDWMRSVRRSSVLIEVLTMKESVNTRDCCMSVDRVAVVDTKERERHRHGCCRPPMRLSSGEAKCTRHPLGIILCEARAWTVMSGEHQRRW